MFIAVFCALVSIYYLTMNILKDSVYSEVKYRNALIGKAISTNTTFMFNEMIDDIRVISKFALSDSDENLKFYQTEVQNAVSKNDLYLFMEIINESGNSVATIPNVNHSSNPNLPKILDRVEWSKTFYISNLLTLEDGRRTIVIAYPILDSEGNYHGSVLAYVNLNILSQYLSQEKIETEGINILLDRNGTIIAHTDEQYIGKSLSKHSLGQSLDRYREGVWEGVLFSKRMLTSYKPITLGGMGLIICESMDQAMKPVNKVQILLMKGFFIVLVLTYLLTMLGTIRIVKPITKLTRQAREYSDGKRDQFDLLQTGDELENLTRTMASMANELKNKERYLFYILESIPYGIITIDKNGRIATFNKGAEDLMKYSRNEAIGKFIANLPIRMSADEYLSWQKLKEGKEINELESYIYDKLGNKHDVRIYSSLFSGEDQNIIGSILIIRDVSEIKKLEEFLKQSERLASLGQLTAGIAHEIKNPLSIIQAATEAIQLDLQDSLYDSSFIQEMTDDILETTDRLNQLLSKFLSLSKGESNNELELVDIVIVLEELLTLLRNQFLAQNISVNKIFEVNEAYVLASHGKLIQIFLNIIINSLDAMEDGGDLTVCLQEKDSNWLIEIEDTGIGIPESEIKWILNPFYTTKKEGTGLGLSIVYEITTQFGGEIHVKSNNSGTKISVQLPKRKVERRES